MNIQIKMGKKSHQMVRNEEVGDKVKGAGY
jgi:hypothetical protein